MKCPYNRKSETHVQGWIQHVNESNVAVRGVISDYYAVEMADCEESNCGAWHKGRCYYAAVNLNNEQIYSIIIALSSEGAIFIQKFIPDPGNKTTGTAIPGLAGLKRTAVEVYTWHLNG